MRNIFYLMVCFLIAVPFGAAQDDREEAFFYGKASSFKAAHEVFKVSCLPCHSARQPLAWHARLPVVSSIKKKEFRKALEGINFDEAVYVAGLTPSLETLDKIEAVIQRDQMPPLDYVLTHWNARLSKKEKWAILDWIRDERRRYRYAAPGAAASSAFIREEKSPPAEKVLPQLSDSVIVMSKSEAEPLPHLVENIAPGSAVLVSSGKEKAVAVSEMIVEEPDETRKLEPLSFPAEDGSAAAENSEENLLEERTATQEEEAPAQEGEEESFSNPFKPRGF